jgi:hypothetical protein
LILPSFGAVELLGDQSPIPGQNGEDDICSRLPHYAAEPLRRPDVSLNGFRICIEPHPAPQSRKVRSSRVMPGKTTGLRG